MKNDFNSEGKKPKHIAEQINHLINTQRDAMDMEQPDSAVWERLQRKMENPKAESRKVISFWQKPMYQVAALILVLIGAALFLLPEKNINNPLQLTAEEEIYQAKPQLRDIETHFASQVSGLRAQVNLIQSELKSVSEVGENAVDHTAFINDLEDAYETLKSNAIESGMDERVITAMINNYRLRIQLLEKLLIELVDVQSGLGKSQNTPSQSSGSPNSNQSNTQDKAPNYAS